MTDTPTPAVPGAMAMTEAKRLYLAFLPGRLRQIRPAEDDDLIAAADHIDAQAAELTRLRAQVREGGKALAVPFVWSEAERDGMFLDYAAKRAHHGEYESLFAAAAWLLRHRQAALAPQPAPTEGGKG